MICNRRLLQTVLVAIVVPIFTYSLLAQDKLHGWRSEGATTAVVLARVDDSPGLQTLVLQNASGRSITALAVSHGTAGDMQTDYIDYLESSAGALAPGDAYSLRLPPGDTAANRGAVIRIDAVLFAGGAGDGLPARLAWMDFKRLGRAFETARIAAILDGPAAAGVDDDGVKALADRISALPQTVEVAYGSLNDVRITGASLEEVRSADKESQTAFLEGVRNAREDGIFKAGQLLALPIWAGGPRARSRASFLQDLKQSYAAKLAVLSNYIAVRKGGLDR